MIDNVFVKFFLIDIRFMLCGNNDSIYTDTFISLVDGCYLCFPIGQQIRQCAIFSDII